MNLQEKEALKQAVKDRLKGKSSYEMIDEMYKMVREVDEGKI